VAYLELSFVEKVARDLPIWVEENNKKGTRFCVVGNGDMEKCLVQFLLREEKNKLNCSLAIYGNKVIKTRVVNAINDEIFSSNPKISLQLLNKIIPIKREMCVFSVYTWTVD
jgi:hypothetical protein